MQLTLNLTEEQQELLLVSFNKNNHNDNDYSDEVGRILQQNLLANFLNLD